MVGELKELNKLRLFFKSISTINHDKIFTSWRKWCIGVSLLLSEKLLFITLLLFTVPWSKICPDIVGGVCSFQQISVQVWQLIPCSLNRFQRLVTWPTPCPGVCITASRNTPTWIFIVMSNISWWKGPIRPFLQTLPVQRKCNSKISSPIQTKWKFWGIFRTGLGHFLWSFLQLD